MKVGFYLLIPRLELKECICDKRVAFHEIYIGAIATIHFPGSGKQHGLLALSVHVNAALLLSVCWKMHRQLQECRYDGSLWAEIVTGTYKDCIWRCWSPVIYLLMEDTEQRNFDTDINSHVILDCIQGPQHKIEDANCISQFWREPLYDNSKAATQHTAIRME